ncbi:MAG: phosphatase PAP2 family protein [Lachnospiraceae bacterium]|nr:phosphatase PAP2 family protein [Lachnospiraceae bacterium]
MEGSTFYFDWEFDLLYWFQSWHSPVMDKIMKCITLFGEEGIFWIVLSLVILIFCKDKRLGWTMAGALVIDVLVLNGLLKHLFERNRPCWIDTTIPLLVENPDDFSFPSGHTGASFAAATALFLRNKKWGVPALVLAVLVAISRLYLFVHFPTDVLVGVVVGVCAGIASFIVVNAFYKDKDIKKFLPLFGQPF